LDGDGVTGKAPALNEIKPTSIVAAVAAAIFLPTCSSPSVEIHPIHPGHNSLHKS
jgi:hypothetical protein